MQQKRGSIENSLQNSETTKFYVIRSQTAMKTKTLILQIILLQISSSFAQDERCTYTASNNSLQKTLCIKQIYPDYIRCGRGRTGVDPHTFKKGAIFLMPLSLSKPIFNKKSHRTQSGECFKLLDPYFAS